MSNDLRQRLLAASRTHIPEVANTSDNTDAVEVSSRTLSSDETAHVEEILSEIPSEYTEQENQEESNSSSSTQLSDFDLMEMFSDMVDGLTAQQSEPETQEEETEEEEDGAEEETVYTPAPESVTVIQEIQQPRRRRSRRGDISAEATSRFSGAIWYDKIKEQDVTVVGVGGIGSWTSLLISRLGVKSLTLYDDDTVELGNISGQFYSSNDVDRFKVDAIQAAINRYSVYYNVTSINQRFENNSMVSPVVISCLDSMSARRTVFNAWRSAVNNSEDKSKFLFIDGRLSAETFQVFAVSGDDDSSIKRYEESIFPDYEADAVVCSYKQTSFMANMIASLITNVFVNYVASTIDGGAARAVPFKTEYLGEMMWFTTEL